MLPLRRHHQAKLVFCFKADQFVKRYIQYFSQLPACLQVRNSIPRFPFGNSLTGHSDFFRQGLLGQLAHFAQLNQVFPKHSVSPGQDKSAFILERKASDEAAASAPAQAVTIISGISQLFTPRSSCTALRADFVQ